MTAKAPTHRPQAQADLLFSELADETLVYDFATHAAHCMAPLAASVLRRSDGSATVKALAASLAVSVAEVEAALDALERAGLLVHALPRLRTNRARRRVLRQLALGAAAPLVWSIVSPSVAEAASRISCIPPAGCMGGGSGCCGTSGSAAMACSGNGSCSGVSFACTGQTCR